MNPTLETQIDCADSEWFRLELADARRAAQAEATFAYEYWRERPGPRDTPSTARRRTGRIRRRTSWRRSCKTVQAQAWEENATTGVFRHTADQRHRPV
jgi:hypothetical protein